MIFKNPEEFSIINEYPKTNDFNWIFKRSVIDMKEISETIDVSKAQENYYTAKYPDLMKNLLTIPKLNDGVEVHLSDLYTWENGTYYFGEWNKVTNEMHGRGITHFAQVGNEGGCSYICQHFKSQYTGIVKMLFDSGKVSNAQYDKGKLVKWL